VPQRRALTLKVRPDGLACFDVGKVERDRGEKGKRSALGKPSDESCFDPTILIISPQVHRETDLG